MEIKNAKVLTRTDIQNSLKPLLEGLVSNLAEEAVMDVNTARRMARALIHEAVKLMMEGRMPLEDMAVQFQQALAKEFQALEENKAVDSVINLSPVTFN